MRVTCNGENREVQEGTSVLDLLQELQVDPATVVVERNGEILMQQQYDMVLEKGAVLEIIRFVGGG